MPNSCIDTIIEELKTQFGDHIQSICGIGSAFQQLPNMRAFDVDLVVFLDNDDIAPRGFKDKLYRKEKRDDLNIWIAFSTIDDYQTNKRFSEISFSDWAWACRGLKYGSTLLYGDDFTDFLPEPPYDYQSIFLRVAYHLDQSWIHNRRDPMLLTKAIFKFGFFLTAIHYPNTRAFSKYEVFDTLNQLWKEGKCLDETIQFYQSALQYRLNIDKDVSDHPFITNFVEQRFKFLQLFIRESMRWIEGATWEKLKTILLQGFGEVGFPNLVWYIDARGYH